MDRDRHLTGCRIVASTIYDQQPQSVGASRVGTAVEGLKHTGIPKVAVVSDGDTLLNEIENVVAVVYRGSRPEGYPAYTIDEIDKLCDDLHNKLLNASTITIKGSITFFMIYFI